MALRSLSRHAASLTAMPLRPLGQRSFAVVTVTSEDEFTSTVKASPKAVAYYTAACVHSLACWQVPQKLTQLIIADGVALAG